MSIIVQSGHETSKSKQLMKKLYERGLSRPADSYTNQMTPEQVSETLYKVLARENMSSANEKMADNVMIDLLLANLDSENWGWESDKNLASLEYWGEVEPDVRFILVFDHPKNVLNNLISEKITIELLDQIMSEWVSYHQTMLGFFEKNQDKAILVEGVFAIKDINSLGVQLKNIAQTLQLKSSWQVMNGSASSIESSNTKLQLQFNVVKNNIFAEIINKYPEVIEIFNTLLDKASIKNSDLIYKTKRTSLDSLVESLNYLEFEEDKKSSLANIEKSLEQKELEAQRLNRELQESNSKRQVLENELKKVSNRIEEKAQSSHPVSTDIEKENELLIVQLHQLQEELERYYIENKKLKSNEVGKSDRTIRDLEQQPTHYGAAERIKQDLPYRLGEKIVKAKQPKHIVSLPFVLAKEYSDFQKNDVSVEKLPPIELYKDAYEADKVKEHLSYKVGKVLVDSTKSPKKMITMPKNLTKEVVEFYKNKKKT